MSSEKDAETVRRLPGYLFDLLDPEERERVERRLSRSSNIADAHRLLRDISEQCSLEDSPHLSDDELAALLEGRTMEGSARSMLRHLLECGDCRLEASVLQAELDHERGKLDGAVRPSRATRGSGWLRAAAMLAAVLVAGLIGLEFGQQRGERSAAAIQPLVLGSARGAADQQVLHLGELAVDGVVLRVETRLGGERLHWELIHHHPDPETVLGGVQRLRSGSGPLRQLEFLIPREMLMRGLYELVVRVKGGEERRWQFTVRE